MPLLHEHFGVLDYSPRLFPHGLGISREVPEKIVFMTTDGTNRYFTVFNPKTQTFEQNVLFTFPGLESVNQLITTFVDNKRNKVYVIFYGTVNGNLGYYATRFALRNFKSDGFVKSLSLVPTPYIFYSRKRDCIYGLFKSQQGTPPPRYVLKLTLDMDEIARYSMPFRNYDNDAYGYLIANQDLFIYSQFTTSTADSVLSLLDLETGERFSENIYRVASVYHSPYEGHEYEIYFKDHYGSIIRITFSKDGGLQFGTLTGIHGSRTYVSSKTHSIPAADVTKCGTVITWERTGYDYNYTYFLDVYNLYTGDKIVTYTNVGYNRFVFANDDFLYYAPSADTINLYSPINGELIATVAIPNNQRLQSEFCCFSTLGRKMNWKELK